MNGQTITATEALTLNRFSTCTYLIQHSTFARIAPLFTEPCPYVISDLSIRTVNNI